LNSTFGISFRNSSGNLHIRLEGVFNGMCAWALFQTIHQRYSGSGRVFVGTAGLTAVMSSGVGLFKALMTPEKMPGGGLYLKGEKGFDIAPEGARVVICGRTVKRSRSYSEFRGRCIPRVVAGGGDRRKGDIAP